MTKPHWLVDLPASHKPIPFLSFPSASLLGVSVYRLTHDAALQADGIVRIAEETNSAFAVTMMDLSVEAEAFGATIQASEDEVPTVIGAMLSADDDGEEGAEAMAVPEVGAARTGMYVEAAKMAKERITDRPVLAGIIGPFSLAGRLMDVSEALFNCICEPDFVHAVLKKVTAFLKNYAAAYKAAGLDGIVMAEPLSGLLSPDLETEFSAPYVKEIIDSVQDENFAVIYHNCGPNTPLMTESIYGNGAAAFHFGDAVDLCDLLSKMPADAIVCGNISPSAQFVGGTPESMREATIDLLEKASKYPNFVLSSGCDIPPSAKWENIRAFFSAAEEFYTK
jgi:uroporphyrinogen decarboxylase